MFSFLRPYESFARDNKNTLITKMLSYFALGQYQFEFVDTLTNKIVTENIISTLWWNIHNAEDVILFCYLQTNFIHVQRTYKICRNITYVGVMINSTPPCNYDTETDI